MSGATCTSHLAWATMALIGCSTSDPNYPCAAVGNWCAVVVLGLDVDVPRVGDLASLAGGLPAFSLPAVPLNLETLGIIFPYAFILRLV